MDEADALTDLRELGEGDGGVGGWRLGRGLSFGSPAVLHTNSLVLQKCIIRPLEEKVFGGAGEGEIKKRTGLKNGQKQQNLIAFKALLTYSFTSRGCHWF